MIVDKETLYIELNQIYEQLEAGHVDVAKSLLERQIATVDEAIKRGFDPYKYPTYRLQQEHIR